MSIMSRKCQNDSFFPLQSRQKASTSGSCVPFRVIRHRAFFDFLVISHRSFLFIQTFRDVEKYARSRMSRLSVVRREKKSHSRAALPLCNLERAQTSQFHKVLHPTIREKKEQTGSCQQGGLERPRPRK
jgi:hypothetical protein